VRALTLMLVLVSTTASAQRPRRPRVIQLEDSFHFHAPRPRHHVVGPELECLGATLTTHCGPRHASRTGTCPTVAEALLRIGELRCRPHLELLPAATALEDEVDAGALRAALHVYDVAARVPAHRHAAMLGALRTHWRLGEYDEAERAAAALLDDGPPEPLASLAVHWLAIVLLERDLDEDYVIDPDFDGPRIDHLPQRAAWSPAVALRALELSADGAAYSWVIHHAPRVLHRFPRVDRGEVFALWIDAHVRNLQHDGATRARWLALEECPTCDADAILDALEQTLVLALRRCAGSPPADAAAAAACLDVTGDVRRLLQRRPSATLALDAGDVLRFAAAHLERFTARDLVAAGDAPAELQARAEGEVPDPPRLRTPAPSRAATPVHGDGDFDPNLFWRVLRRRDAELRTCAPRRGAAFRVAVTVATSGEVTEVEVDGPRRPRRCVADALRALRFRPGPDGGSWTARGTLFLLGR